MTARRAETEDTATRLRWLDRDQTGADRDATIATNRDRPRQIRHDTTPPRRTRNRVCLGIQIKSTALPDQGRPG